MAFFWEADVLSSEQEEKFLPAAANFAPVGKIQWFPCWEVIKGTGCTRNFSEVGGKKHPNGTLFCVRDIFGPRK